MDSILEYQFRVGINRLKEDNFQDFIKVLLLKVYGNEFDITKNCKDKGCDGIIKKDKIIAVYSPESKPTLRDFKKKVDSDYKKYETNWKSAYPLWEFFYNGEFTASMLEHINNKGTQVTSICINKIIEIINNLNWSTKREIAINQLRINESYITNNVLKEIIDDLIKVTNPQSPKRTIPPDILKKIELNYCAEDVQVVVKQHLEMMPRVLEFQKILNSYNADEIASLKMKITEEYKKFSGTFKDKFNLLADTLAGANKNDGIYMLNLYAVLIYFFQICLIGQEIK